MRMSTAGLVFFLSFTITMPAFAGKAPGIKDYPLDQVAEHVYVIHGPLGMPGPENQGFMNNPGFVVTADGIVVVDPGSSVQIGEMLLRVMATVSDKPVIAVFNTHIHGDHWLGNQAIREAYPDVSIYGHANMIALIESGEGQAWVDMLQRMTEGKTDGTSVVGPNQSIKHGDEFRHGGLTFKVHHYGKSHTTSDIMIEVPELSVTFLGDNVLNDRVPRIDEGDLPGNIATCTEIMKTGSGIYVPGHGPSGDRQVPENFQRYLQILHETVKKYYDEGMSDFEMKDQVAAALGDYSSWNGFDEQLGRHISIAYLQIEAAEF